MLIPDSQSWMTEIFNAFSENIAICEHRNRPGRCRIEIYKSYFLVVSKYDKKYNLIDFCAEQKAYIFDGGKKWASTAPPASPEIA